MKLLLILLVFVCASCATRTPVTDKLHKKAESFRIENVPVIKQEENHCGPASLAMVMNHYGMNQTPEELARGLFHEKLKGSFFPEMKSRARSEGMIVIEVNDLSKVFEEVRAGHPVIILQNNGFQFFPQWHFAVLSGMDFDGPDVYVTGEKQDMRLFERSFVLGGRRSLVLLPPDKLSATGSELEHVESAAILENTGKKNEALLAYQTILGKWETSLIASIGAANVLYEKNEKLKAREKLQAASLHHPQSPLVWHNLAIIEGETGNKKRARESAKKALELAQGPQKEKFMVSLKDWL